MVGNKMTLTLHRGTSNIWAFEVVNILFKLNVFIYIVFMTD